ncbi:MAG: metallophosphoesterase [Candidatus Aminicenantes bacterium]|nr:metallophosphoesterase [Candidatus Aminicenantes bacterium]
MTAARFRPLLLYCLSLVFLAFPAFSRSADIPYEWTTIERIIVIGDLHGDYDNFVKILKGTQVVDPDLHWAAGKVHLVQTGDVMDRGIDARRIFDLLMRLEKEAEEAGGMVHVLLGNHEEMNLTGTVFSGNRESVTLDQFRTFLPDGYRKQEEDSLVKRIIKLRSRDRYLREKDVVDAFWSSLRDSPSAQRQYVINLNEQYGDWLRELNVAIKINDIVFVHGGISEKYSRWGLREINNRFRLEIADYWRAYRRRELPRLGQPQILYRGDSPLWYREFATVPEEDLKEELDATLANLGAKTMIIAHTPNIPKNPVEMQRFGGKIWIVDTGISHVYGGPAAALVIQNGYFNVWGLNDEDNEESNSLGASLLRLQLEPFCPIPDAR